MKLSIDIKTSKIFSKIQQKVSITCKKQALLEENDRLLVGLSGGKDSMVLMEILTAIRNKLPFTLEIFAVHVSVIAPGFQSETKKLVDFCASLHIPLHSISISPDLNNPSKTPCFICSWHRRKAIFNLAKELNCNKLSFGHHRDDALNTLMMNMIYHSSISSLPYRLSMFDGKIELIRPLLDIWENEIDEYAGLKGYASMEKSCPHEKETNRNYVNTIISMLNKDNPQAKNNIFHSMGNICQEYLPSFKGK